MSQDFLGDYFEGPTVVLKEVLEGMYENLSGEIEPGEEQAHIVIKGPDNDWVVTCRKIPSQEASVEKKEKVSEPA